MTKKNQPNLNKSDTKGMTSSHNSSTKKSKHQSLKKLKKITIPQICGINWDYFDMDNFIKNMTHKKILIYGLSGEGKSFFAAQIIFNKICLNIKNNIKTLFSASSQTRDALNLIECVANTVLKLFPKLKKNWNTDSCLVQFSHSNNLSIMTNLIDSIKNLSDDEMEIQNQTEKIWYFDDMGNKFSDQKQITKGFFDELCSNGRHYNITSIFCTQKLQLPKIILSQSNPVCFVGSISNQTIKIFLNNCVYHFDQKLLETFFKYYSRNIGLINSRNILIFDSVDKNYVYLHKVGEEFVNFWEKLTLSNQDA